MDKVIAKDILDVVMTKIGKSLTIQDFKFKDASEEDVLKTLQMLVDEEYLLASELCTESAEKCVIFVNNVTGKGLKLHEELR